MIWNLISKAYVQVADYQTKTKHVIFAIGNMKAIKEIKENSKLEIQKQTIDGVAGILHMTGLRKCTFIASWGGGWEHVSVCPSNRLPDWDEMCAIKDMFWNEIENGELTYDCNNMH